MAIIWSSTVTYEILTLTIWTLVAVSPKTLGDATVFHLLFLTSLCLRSNKAFCCTLCMQARLYQLIEAAGITYISIGHRSTLYKYHKKVLHISTANTTSNQRNWSFKNVGEDSIYDFSKQQLWANNFSFSTWYYCLDAYRSPDCSRVNFQKFHLDYAVWSMDCTWNAVKFWELLPMNVSMSFFLHFEGYFHVSVIHG